MSLFIYLFIYFVDESKYMLHPKIMDFVQLTEATFALDISKSL